MTPFMRALLAAALAVACSAGGSPARRRAAEQAAGGALGGEGGGAGVGAPVGTGGAIAPGQAPIFHVDAGPMTKPGCNDISVGFEKLIPTILLLVDESGSMADNKYPPGGAQSRWRVLHDALLADGGLVQKLQ